MAHPVPVTLLMYKRTETDKAVAPEGTKKGYYGQKRVLQPETEVAEI